MSQETENQDQKTALMIEAKDDEQIMEELKGRIVEEYFYEFKLGERTVTGISWAGIKQLARVQGNVRVSHPEVQETDQYFRVICSAEDPSRNIIMWGATQQPKKMKLKDGSEMEDTFSLTKALSKAQRNAIRALFPETIIKHAYEMWKAKKTLPEAKGAVQPPTVEVTREELEQLLGEELMNLRIEEKSFPEGDYFKVIQLKEIPPLQHKEIGTILATYGGRYQPGPWGSAHWLIPKKGIKQWPSAGTPGTV